MNASPEAARRIGVVGGGRMGAGIAQVFAVLGCDVILVENSDPEGARERVIRGLRNAARHSGGGGSEPDEVLARLEIVETVDILDQDLALVVEAVPESPALKVEVLSGISRAVGHHTLIASNTSSIAISELALAVDRPERFFGMHFFNPVPASALVEIVRTAATSPETIAQARRWVADLGKTDIVVVDSPGFATSRLGVCLALEATRMLEEGVADAASIDTAMELGYRHPLGPLKSGDLVGLDVRLAISEYLASTLGERFEPPQLLRDLVRDGHLGRKSGRGFYDYTEDTVR
ncbi:3-hydroxybutyryl-CoA dehydrogenase [Microbacterium sp. Leaf288]|uniref:3-hydroxyacyl-CoA dehydrogenase family protein n=1 Tax=Microbacterium sp. Leaf288 TaxID=1736323 RepID=UPI0006FAACB8|nr:3-hydroxyacyl-CoA dehydrogenase family protein [Microbacterium sp. Leaf288]KQP69998.1 3-hydroxybutyryl-CoA dehydrogenase [Microbacterium sp. Leaf288]